MSSAKADETTRTNPDLLATCGRDARRVTAAALIMVSVFGAFSLSTELILKLIGVGLASAILIDAILIRMVLLPAVMRLLGEGAWWTPGRASPTAAPATGQS